MANKNQPGKARIATALVLAFMAIVATPIAAADDPEVGDDGSASYGDCAEIDVWTLPPAYYVNAEECIGGD